MPYVRFLLEDVDTYTGIYAASRHIELIWFSNSQTKARGCLQGTVRRGTSRAESASPPSLPILPRDNLISCCPPTTPSLPPRNRCIRQLRITPPQDVDGNLQDRCAQRSQAPIAPSSRQIRIHSQQGHRSSEGYGVEGIKDRCRVQEQGLGRSLASVVCSWPGYLWCGPATVDCSRQDWRTHRTIDCVC